MKKWLREVMISRLQRQLRCQIGSDYCCDSNVSTGVHKTLRPIAACVYDVGELDNNRHYG